jgi:hypothetical protein
MLPWGLTVAQTLCLGIGGLLLLGGWIVLTALLRLSRTLLVVGLAAIMGLVCLVAALFAIYELTR